MPSAVSTPHSKFQLNHVRHFWDMNFQNWFSFFVFIFFSIFSSFRKGVKVTIRWKQIIQLPWNWYTEKWCKHASWYQFWLEYNKHSQRYLQLFMKKIPICGHAHRVNCEWQEAENLYRGRLTSTLLWFERNWAIDHKGTIKNQRCVIVMRFRIANKMPLLPDKLLSRINWKLVCGWINKL